MGGESFDEGVNTFTIGLWGVGSSVGCVVLMNFVIADMGSTYERVKERSTVVRRKELVGLLLEAERIISIPAAGRRFLDRVLGEYLFICMKATQRDDSAVDAWDSFTGSIKNHTNAVEKRLTDGMSEKLRKLDERQQKTEDALRQLQDGQQKIAAMVACFDAKLEGLAVLQAKEQGVGVETPTLAAPLPEPPRS